ncbi:MFS transporter, partial [Enterococcus faecium]|nr:MFS transporter [Enterococcus faecium]
MVALLGLMYGFQLMGESSFSWITLVISFVIFIVGAGLFIRQEKRAEDPIIFLDLFNNRTFVIQNVATMLVSGLLIGFEVYLPSWT